MKSFERVLLSLTVAFLFLSLNHVAYGIEGKVLLLNDDVYTQAIETDDGRIYEIGAIAQHKDTDKAKEILTELEIDKNSKKVIKVKSSYEISENDHLKQVALIPKIVEGRILPRRDFRPNKVVIGLVFFRIGDITLFNGKKLTLERFEEEKAIWRGDDGLYTVKVVENNGKAEYSLKKYTP